MQWLFMSVSFPNEFGVSCPVLVKRGREVKNYNIITNTLNFCSFLEKRTKLISPLTEGFQDKTNVYLFWLCLPTAVCVCVLGLAAVCTSFCPGTARGENKLWEELCIEHKILLEPWHQRRTGCAGSWD